MGSPDHPLMWLQILGGVLWLATYLLLIRRGFKDRSCGMPMVALCLNVSWEFLFSFVFLTGTSPQRFVNMLWFAFDLLIVYQYLRFERPAEPATPRERLFGRSFLVTLATSFAAIYWITVEAGDGAQGGYYTAFGQNLGMSILFVHMLLERNDTSGQSMYIGLAKLAANTCFSVATVAALMARGWDSRLIIFLSVAIFVYDVVYVWLLRAQFTQAGEHPWRTW